MVQNRSQVTERFLRYAAVDTQSADDMEQMPSNRKAKVLGHMLAEELKELGVSDVREDEKRLCIQRDPLKSGGRPSGTCSGFYFPYGYSACIFRHKRKASDY